MLPTDLLPYIVDEFSAYDSVGEMTVPCKLSPLSRTFGSMAHKAMVGRMKKLINFLNIVKAIGHVQVLMGESLRYTFYKGILYAAQPIH